MKTGNSKFVVIGAIALVAVLVLSVYYIFSNKAQKQNSLSVQQNDERSIKTIHVTAANGKFDPVNLETELFTDINLEINATDKDYQFKVESYPRLDTEIKKGETKTIQLYSLGVGEYIYSCGSGCAGKLTVRQQADMGE